MLNFKRIRKILITSAILLLIIIIFSTPFIVHNIEHAHDHDHSPDRDEQTDILSYVNRDVINNFFGESETLSILNCLENNILTDQEKSTAPKKNSNENFGNNYYTLTFDENSIKTLNVNDSSNSINFDYTYSFSSKTSDDRNYQIITMIKSILNKPDQDYTIIKNLQSNKYILCKLDDQDHNNLLKSWVHDILKIPDSSIQNL